MVLAEQKKFKCRKNNKILTFLDVSCNLEKLLKNLQFSIFFPHFDDIAKSQKRLALSKI